MLNVFFQIKVEFWWMFIIFVKSSCHIMSFEFSKGWIFSILSICKFWLCRFCSSHNKCIILIGQILLSTTNACLWLSRCLLSISACSWLARCLLSISACLLVIGSSFQISTLHLPAPPPHRNCPYRPLHNLSRAPQGPLSLLRTLLLPYLLPHTNERKPV